MSKYVHYYNDRQEAYRTLARQYVNWTATENTAGEAVAEFSKFFTKVAKRFGLIKEFRARGVI